MASSPLPPPPGGPQIEYEPRWRRERGTPVLAVLAWAVVIVIAVGIPIVQVLKSIAPVEADPQPGASAGHVDAQMTILGKYSVGAARLQPESKQAMLTQVDATAKAPPQRVAAAVLHGEFSGKDAAIRKLDLADAPHDAEAFRDLYTEGKPLASGVADRYGFFARLASVHGRDDSDPARAAVLAESQRAFAALVGVTLLLVLLLTIGLALFVTAIVLCLLGKLRLQAGPPVGAARTYIEAVAIYLGSYVSLSIVIQLIAPDAPMWLRATPLVLGVLVATVWPIARGVRWKDQRADWGIHPGRNPFVEMLAGVGGYVAGLPILGAGLLITMLLSKWAQVQPSHPIVDEIARNPLPLFLLAAVFAPVTEELMFRGALLSHLRGKLGPIVSGLIVGLIFAAIHPQGWAAIPTIGAIGFVLSLIRQWRGSLIAPITAHALNNGCVVTLLILMAG